MWSGGGCWGDVLGRVRECAFRIFLSCQCLSESKIYSVAEHI